MIELYQGDCLHIMQGIEDKSIDCIIVDPPYFGIVNEKWDKQWETLQDYIDWLELTVIESKRVLKDNGSFYIFSDDKNAAYVQVMVDKYLLLLNNIVWHKTNNMPIKNAHLLRSFAPMTERILFYTPQLCKTGLETVKLDINNFLPLRDYFKRLQQEWIHLGIKKINDKFGHRRSEHAFYWNSTQWDLPTKEVYQDLVDNFFINDWNEFREYEDLKNEQEKLQEEYEKLRLEYESKRRTFNAGSGLFDVIQLPIVGGKENSGHPTTKPLKIIETFVKASTNEGDTVLDFTMGSGTTGIACKLNGRSFIGIEKDPQYFKIAQQRIKKAEHQLTF